MQVLVEHPEAFVKHIKQCLSSKKGIPVKQQRLVFSGPGAQALEESQETSKQQPAVEEILSSLSQWQVGQSLHCAFSANFEGTRVAALHDAANQLDVYIVARRLRMHCLCASSFEISLTFLSCAMSLLWTVARLPCTAWTACRIRQQCC